MGATTIERVDGWEGLDSRGIPTVGVRVTLQGGASRVVHAPGGTSQGVYEVSELRDGGERHLGKGVLQAVDFVVHRLGPRLVGLDASVQSQVDQYVRDLIVAERGASEAGNASIAVSVAVFLAASDALGEPLWKRAESCTAGPDPVLPRLIVNLFSGGRRAGNAFDIQDLCVVPLCGNVAEQVHIVERVRVAAQLLLEQGSTRTRWLSGDGRNDMSVDGNEVALDLAVESIQRAGYKPGTDVGLWLDMASGQRWNPSGRLYRLVDGREMSSDQLRRLIASWVAAYPVVAVEDPWGEDDTDGWRNHSGALRPALLVGDDLFATQPSRVRDLAESVECALLKPNQNGTVTGTLMFAATAGERGLHVVASDRSGETCEDWLVDVALTVNAVGIKLGSTTRSERVSKLNRLLELASTVGSRWDAAAWPTC